MSHTVTYSPEDNKLRLYVGRVPRDEYERLRAAGFVSTPKQDCDFVAVWTPTREDIASEYLEDGEDIGDEDYSPEERAADRAERFEGYRDKRRDEATGHADKFEAGPAAFGHQNRQRAERAAMRHDRQRVKGVSQWSKAEYWQQRTAGVIRHALHKSDASTRRGRILTLEAEQRKHEASREGYRTRYNAWLSLCTMEGADVVLPMNEDGYADPSQMNAAQLIAYTLANDSHYGGHMWHPTDEAINEKARQIWGHGFSAYDLISRCDFAGQSLERITPRQYAEMYIAQYGAPDNPESSSARWSEHYKLRLSYEMSMLENEGGLASAVEMEPGGWIRVGGSRDSRFLVEVDGWAQVLKVNRSPVTKRVTSVVCLGRKPYSYCDKSEREKIREVQVNIERAGEDCYRAPTDDERAAFTKSKKDRKDASPKAPPTINPTEAEAQKLQDYLNSQTKSPPRPIDPMTQAKYSDRARGDMYRIKTFTLNGITFKCRMRHAGFYDYNAAESVVVLTDKPQKPFGVNWAALSKPVVEVGQLF